MSQTRGLILIWLETSEKIIKLPVADFTLRCRAAQFSDLLLLSSLSSRRHLLAGVNPLNIFKMWTSSLIPSFLSHFLQYRARTFSLMSAPTYACLKNTFMANVFPFSSNFTSFFQFCKLIFTLCEGKLPSNATVDVEAWLLLYPLPFSFIKDAFSIRFSLKLIQYCCKTFPSNRHKIILELYKKKIQYKLKEIWEIYNCKMAENWFSLQINATYWRSGLGRVICSKESWF